MPVLDEQYREGGGDGGDGVCEEVRRWFAEELLREAVDACQLLTSPAYHLVRSWHGLAEAPYLGQRLDYILSDPNLQHV